VIKKAKNFLGGVHPKPEKSLTRMKTIEPIGASDIVAISVAQHIGKPAIPVVSKGDKVLQGQLIAKADGFVSSNIHSSVSGEVLGIETKTFSNGSTYDCVVIKNDGLYTSTLLPDLTDRSLDGIRKRIFDAGIVGMGGAGFPTHVKLAPKVPVDTLIINAAECEPYITCDFRLMLENPEEVAKGIRIMAEVLNVKQIAIGIEVNKPEAIEIFSKFNDFDIYLLKAKYPMGSEKHLVYSCTGRKIAPKQLPSEVGVVVQNVATAYAVYEAVEKNKPLFERAVTVSGRAITEPKNLRVKLGTSYEHLLTYCGGVKANTAMLVSGGPMMGAALYSAESFTRKTDGGILVLAEGEAGFHSPTPCISCGKCAHACPMNLLPMLIDFYTLARDYEKAQIFGGVKNCISCGSCSFACPANRAILQSIVLCKQMLNKNDRMTK